MGGGIDKLLALLFREEGVKRSYLRNRGLLVVLTVVGVLAAA